MIIPGAVALYLCGFMALIAIVVVGLHLALDFIEAWIEGTDSSK